jgi:tetratricopeptide (TPR) repeat protein
VVEALLHLHGPDDPEHALELAQHSWAAASVTGPGAALPHVLAAADHAMARLAVEQAEQQLRRALELLESIPPSAESTRTALDVKVQLGDLLSQLGGEGMPEAAAVFAGAAELATEVADDGAALPAIAGVHASSTLRAEHDQARALAERVLHGARRSGDQRAPLAGHFLLGKSLYCLGELEAARDHLEEAVRLAASDPEASGLPGIARGLSAESLLEVVLVLLGLPEAAASVAVAVGRAVERSHQPYPNASAMVNGVYASLLRRDLPLLRGRAARAGTLAERWGFRILAAAVMAPLGWAQAMDGDPAGGAKLLRQGLGQLASAGVQVTRPLLLGLLAEVEQLAGRPSEALHLLDDALAHADRSGEFNFEAELHRLRGESLLGVSQSRAAEAEAALHTSIVVAGRQGAKLFEERATASLARLRTARRAQSSR